MITEFILRGFQTAVSLVLGILPDIPSMPENISSAMNFVVGLIGDTVGVIAYIYTPPVFVFIFAFFLAILGFDMIYKLALWILHKIRG